MTRSDRAQPLSDCLRLAPVALALAGLAGAAPAQTAAPVTPVTPATPPAEARPQQIEITGTRPNEGEERRRSTAAKIVVGRDEIERFGDASLGELLKRLPGVTLDGNAGRGGNIRMRGLGSGYTQILLDGERVQGGLSLDSLDPEQVERIEILRAPTAETGARAIAGTINIVMREGFRKRLNDLRLGAGLENGRGGGNLNWSRDDQLTEALSYNLSLSAWGFERSDRALSTTVSDELDLSEASQSSSRRHGLHLNNRLQWRLGEGESLMLMPMLTVSRGDTARNSQMSVWRTTPALDPGYADSHTDSDNDYRLARLNGLWRHTLAQGARAEWRGGLGQSVSESQSLRQEFDEAGTRTRLLDEGSRATELTAHLNGKLSLLLDSAHSLVGGLELDAGRRREQRSSLEDGVSQLDALGSEFKAATRRVAVYAQDEWSINPNWAAHAGLRWEGIEVQGQGAQGDTPANRSSVWTPLLHAVWKPDPKSRDQLRISLTRSYRSPGLSQLLGLPNISNRYPVPGENTATSPDRAGNPALRPELATGIDLALERYLPGGGMLSANLFHRQIKDLMRTVTTLETVSWSEVPRWVARPTNLGDAVTQGLELEAKFALADVWADAPKVDLRSNASLFRSRVDGVPGPDNRLDQQPQGTLNLGADWKPRGTPLTLGANLNYTPGYTTRLTETQWIVQGRKRAVDAYALWQVSPHARLRLSAGNLLPEDAVNTTITSDERATSTSPTFVSWRLQLELKL